MHLSPEERHRAQAWQAEIDRRDSLLQAIADALGTEETGAGLVEAARTAHQAELAQKEHVGTETPNAS